ncbi:hypothetical protein QQ045_018067 [Rhodiola kirilowii]
MSGGRSLIEMMEDEKGWLAQALIDTVNEIAAISDFRPPVKKQYCNLARRLKLLTPMFEEIKDSKDAVPEESMNALMALRDAMDDAKEILKLRNEGSKIYLVLEREKIMSEFQEVTAKLEKALSGISYEKLDISDEVKEQVELVLSQFKRAKGKVDTPDVELYENLLSLYNTTSETASDPDVIKRVAEKLQLLGITDLTQESLALHEMVLASGGDPGENIEKISNLLKKIKDFVQTENPNFDARTKDKSGGPGAVNSDTKLPLIPDDFRCPISLELMKDPVIVSTGQVKFCDKYSNLHPYHLKSGIHDK